MKAYADPEIRAKLHEEAVVNKPDTAVGFSKTWWNYMWVNEPVLEKNQWMQFKSIGQIAEKQNKRVIDAFLDLVVEEKLETRFLQAENNVDDEALTKILTHPNAVIGLGDGGAHVQFHGGYGYLTKLLGEWVREKQVMTLEQAVRRLTFDSASTFGLYDRGLLAPRHGRRCRDLRPGDRQVRPGGRRPRLPEGRLAHQGAGRGHLRHDRQRPGAVQRRQAHRRIARRGYCATPTTTPTTPERPARGFLFNAVVVFHRGRPSPAIAGEGIAALLPTRCGGAFGQPGPRCQRSTPPAATRICSTNPAPGRCPGLSGRNQSRRRRNNRSSIATAIS